MISRCEPCGPPQLIIITETTLFFTSELFRIRSYPRCKKERRCFQVIDDLVISFFPIEIHVTIFSDRVPHEAELMCRNFPYDIYRRIPTIVGLLSNVRLNNRHLKDNSWHWTGVLVILERTVSFINCINTVTKGFSCSFSWCRTPDLVGQTTQGLV